MMVDRQNDELIKIDGWVNIEFDFMGMPIGYPPNYLDSHDAVQRMIDGFDDVRLNRYLCHLADIVSGEEKAYPNCWLEEIVKATPAQKCEAILKAFGKWDDD